MKYVKSAWLEILVALFLIYKGQYVALLILAYVFFQCYLLAKRIDYNRKILRFINFQTSVNLRLMRKHLKIEDAELSEADEQLKQEIGHKAYKNLEKEFKEIGLAP
ncbi:MAG: hypothetical protein ACXWOX_16425 [Ktedonobacteraceae bacterium]